MRKAVFAMLFVSLWASSLMGYSDSDLDGVEDSVDKCPDTPITDLVGLDGCTKKSLKPKGSWHHYDVIVGFGYSGSNFASLNRSDTAFTSVQADYYYKDFSLQAYTSYYTTKSDTYSQNGLNDSFVGIAYTFRPNRDLTLRLGGGALLPTYKTGLNNNNTDYTASLNLSYTLEKLNFFGGYVYTQINDDEVSENNVTYSYNNTKGYTLGVGYYLRDVYLSGSYNLSESIYPGVEDIQTLSAYAYKTFTQHIFMTLYYAYGVSDTASDHALSVRLGWYF